MRAFARSALEARHGHHLHPLRVSDRSSHNALDHGLYQNCVARTGFFPPGEGWSSGKALYVFQISNHEC